MERRDTLEQQLEISLDPDRDRGGLHQRPRVGIDERPAAGAEYDVPVLEQPGNDVHLTGAKIGLAVGRENVLDGHAGGLLHLLVAVDEVAAQAVGEAPADRGLAGAHHADQDDRPVPEEPLQLVALLVACGRASRHSDFPVRAG